METLPIPRMSPKEFFLYLGVLITLYISAGSLITLWFRIVDVLFQDTLYGGAYSQSFYMYSTGMRFAIASLIVIFPIYLAFSWIVRKSIIADASKGELAVRKWFVYLTLFVAGATAVGDLITALNLFLGGEITTRFILKAVVILVIALGIFGYYLYDLRRTDVRARKSVVLLAGAVVLGSLIVGFWVMGSPTQQRSYRFDDQRVNDLQTIQWQVRDYWERMHALPPALTVLNDDMSGFRVPVDPESGLAYEYRIADGLSFELCAVFAREQVDRLTKSAQDDVIYPLGYNQSEQWNHGVGRTCFTRTIDPTRYALQ